ncbi:hypothetical protein [Lactobacillus intestinalis]|uniref:hypothetical protein n=1 Tax=Lactobacillus intestinalis TaxID=151781 RepID=UPI0025A96CBB|nr:hypothetical protein [Lactobacillus intestinalis]
MAEETTKQEATVSESEKDIAPVTTNTTEATEEVPSPDQKEKVLIKSNIYHQYYVSDDNYPYEPIEAQFIFDGDTYYPFVKTAPDPSLKAPKFDWQNHVWIENEASAVSQQVVQVNERLGQLNAGLEKMQEQHALDAKKTETADKQLQMMQQMLANSNAVMGQLSGQISVFGQALNTINQNISNLKPKDAQQESNTQTTTDTTKEGEVKND